MLQKAAIFYKEKLFIMDMNVIPKHRVLRNLWGIHGGNFPLPIPLRVVGSLLAYRIEAEKTIPEVLTEEEVGQLVSEGFAVLGGKQPTGPYVSNSFLAAWLSACQQRISNVDSKSLAEHFLLFKQAVCTPCA